MKIKYEVVKYTSSIIGGVDNNKVIATFDKVEDAIEYDKNCHFDGSWTIIEVNYQC